MKKLTALTILRISNYPMIGALAMTPLVFILLVQDPLASPKRRKAYLFEAYSGHRPLSKRSFNRGGKEQF